MESYNGLRRTPIQEFFKGRSVFITGGTGFCGKVLIEKLLRSCPDIVNLFILIRPKKGVDVSQRLEQMKTEPVFKHLREMYDSESIFKKLVAIHGDISSPELGISTQDQSILCDTVSVVFHVGATVRFNENLRTALQINVGGTKAVIDLCKRMTKLKALVYMSTAFSHCPLTEIKEELLEPPIDPDFLSGWLERLTEEQVREVEKICLGKWPNTYSYTKALAEYIIERNKGDLPVAICRPSIVLSSWSEPFPGWIDSPSGPTLSIPLLSQGKIRSGLVSKEKNVDLVPVDMLANFIIAISWETANTERNSHLETVVYNFVTGDLNSITWGHFFARCVKYMHVFPSEHAMWYCMCWLFSSRMAYDSYSFLVEYIPCILVDVMCCIGGNKIRYVKLYKKAKIYLELLYFFSNREWTFCNDNIKTLLKKVSAEDRKMFNFDIKQIVWEDYIKNYVKGVKMYLQKEDIQNLVYAKRRYRLFIILHRVLQFMILYGLYGLVQKCLGYIRGHWI